MANPAEMIPNLPDRLRELRLEFGWSLNDVAKLVGVTQPGVVSNWETTNQRRRTPELASLLILQKWYGVSMDYLLGQEEAERDSPIVKAGKRRIWNRLMDPSLAKPVEPSDRARYALTTAIKEAPDAFFEARAAAFLGMKCETLTVLLQNGIWAPHAIERLGEFLGLNQEWFYSPDSSKLLHGSKQAEGRTP